MKIYRQQTEIYDIRPENSSSQRVVHMGENMLNLTFRTTQPLDLRINDYVVFENTTYKFKTLCNPTRKSRHEFEYICQLFSPQYDLQDVLFVLEDETGVGVLDETIPIFGSAHFQLQQIVKCVKTVHPEWVVGDVQQTSEEKNITYTDMDCLEAVQHMASEFNIEYWITGTSISLGKKKYGNPITFKYGKGDALYELSRQNQEGRITTALRVRGSDRNIDSLKYGSKYLHMPNNEHFIYQNTDKYGIIQGRMSFPEIYPRLVHKNPGDPGAVTSVRQDEDGIWFVKDDNLNFDIELLSKETLVVDFQTGQLGGLKIDANWHPAEKEYELIVGDYGLGQDIPSPTFVPAVGDLYLLSNLKMPQAYFDMAEQELYAAGVEAIKQLCEGRVSYKGPVNPLYFRTLGETIETGRAVTVEDDDIVDGGGSVELRVQAYTRGVNDDLSLDIEISDTLYVSRIDKIENIIKENKNDADQKINYGDAYTKRRFRDAKETIELLENAQLNFSEAINPIAVQTMQLLVGDESLQFRYVNGRLNPLEIDHTMRYNNDTRMFRTGGNGTEVIQHMTLGIDSLAPTHKSAEYKFWDIPPFSELLPDSAARYVYLKCSKTNETGSYILSKTSIKIEAVSGYYHFLAAIINSEFEGVRSFAPMYGFTEITPGQMRVNKIINTDGTQFWDMLSKRFRIGDANSFVSWNVDKPNQLVIKGTLVQSPSGDTDFIGVDRGDYVYGTPYFAGDLVKYGGNMYKCIRDNTGIYPTNATYWKKQISKGDDGNSVKYIYRRSVTQPSTPTGNAPSGWSNAPYSGSDPMWISEATFNSANSIISTWSYPIRFTGEDGKEGQGYMYAYKGENTLNPPQRPTSAGGYLPSGWSATPNIQGFRYMYQTQCVKTNGVWGSWSQPVLFNYTPAPGDPGPGIVFRGRWDQITPAAFYNNKLRRDVIATSWGTYYLFKGTDGETIGQGQSWVWESKWEVFGAQFSSVATDLLFTPNGNVGGWIFKNEQMESQSGGAYMNGKTGAFQLGNGNFSVDASGNVGIKGLLSTKHNKCAIEIKPYDNSGNSVYATDQYGNPLFALLANEHTANQFGGHIWLGRYGASYQGFNTSTRTVIHAGSIDIDNPNAGFNISKNVNGTLYARMYGLPTSGTGLPPGAIYRSGDTLKVVT